MKNVIILIFGLGLILPEAYAEEPTQNVITEKPLFEIAVSKCEDTLYNDGGEMIGVFQIDLSVKNLSDKKLEESLFSFNVLDTAGEPLGNGGCFVERLRPGKTTRKQVILGTYPESWWKNFCDPNSGKMTLELSEVSCKFEGDTRNEDCFDRVKVKKGKLPIHR